jgi:hypothetical protein
MMASRGKWLLVILALPIGMMFLLPGVVRGGMWVGVQTGPTYCATADVGERSWAGAGTEKTYKDVKFDVNFLGGLVVGYDFVHEGFLGRAWPSWMKYFSLVLDATYENMSFQHQGVIVEVKGKSTVSGFFPSGTFTMFSVVPMLIGKYGFIPNAEMPFGRLQPYVGVGAGIIISNSEVSNLITRERNKLDVPLVMETGLRYMLSRNVSLDAAFRYRIIPTAFGNSYEIPGDMSHNKIDLDFKPELYNAILRVSYHF